MDSHESGPIASSHLGTHEEGVLAVVLELREALDAPWDELASLWGDLDQRSGGPHRNLYDRLFAGLIESGDRSNEDLLVAVAARLRADPKELRELIAGYCGLLGLDPVVPELAVTVPSLSAVHRLWWLKARLGVSVAEFLRLASHLQSEASTIDLFSRSNPGCLLRAVALVQWSRWLGTPLLDLLAWSEQSAARTR
ncbi:MAG: hypothetical protein Q8M76_14170 [Spirochaetaceae bacterium]|nr:hypothetical protein [Spirochaetaceae bacterium]